jgi:hypothetical protein
MKKIFGIALVLGLFGACYADPPNIDPGDEVPESVVSPQISSVEDLAEMMDETRDVLGGGNP